MPDATTTTDRDDIRAISQAFREARTACLPLAGYPGTLPARMDDAYRIQAESIAAWSDQIAGWKVGGVPLAVREQLGAERVTGPIFRRTVHRAAPGSVTRVPVISGGFAAFEAEFVIELADLSGLRAVPDDVDGVSALVRRVFAGVEVAGSPLATINEIGPIAVASDFGNNAGLVIGDEIAFEGFDRLAAIETAVVIDGREIGRAHAVADMTGPAGAVAFLIAHLRRQGVAIPAGLLVSTGAITGVHEAAIGSRSQSIFAGSAPIEIDLIAAGR